MTASSLVGYLDDAYLVGPPGYLAATYGEFSGVQVSMKISDQNVGGQQSEMSIESPDDDFKLGMQAEMIKVIETETGFQAEMLLQGPDDDYLQGMQTDFKVTPETTTGMQAKIFPLQHWLHPKYLVEQEGYLEYSYLSSKMCAFQGMQAKMFVDSPTDDLFLGMQSEMSVVSQPDTGLQVKFVIQDENNVGMQANMIKTLKQGAQAAFVIYNTTQLRFLCQFPSRGTVAEYNGTPSANNANWETDQAIKANDLGKLQNLNTDVLEERIETDGVTAFWELRCDTGATNTFVDTLAILEHNLTTSATITFQGSDSPTFSTVKFSDSIQSTEVNAYRISPTLPTLPAKYYRLLINDPSNSDGFLRIGTIIFGSSDIFTLKECYQNPIRFGKTHFKDTISTEGFTNKSNDRATRKRLGLAFEKLAFDGGNYELLQDMMDFAKTDLKCLVIPVPQNPTSLTVFAKLTQLPDEQHIADDVDNHLVDFSLDWDESL